MAPPTKTCAAAGGTWDGQQCGHRKSTVIGGCSCQPIYGNTSCGGDEPGTWSCWGLTAGISACTQGYGLHPTGWVSGGPTGFICVGE